LPPNLIHNYSRRNCCIQGRYFSLHRNINYEIALFGNQSSIPSPSLPITRATGPFKSASKNGFSPERSVPTIHMFFFFRYSIVCEIFVTRATGTYSIAPAEAFETAALSPIARLFGMTTRGPRPRRQSLYGPQIVRIGNAVQNYNIRILLLCPVQS